MILPSSKKRYKCKECGLIKELETNHYGDCYSWGHYNCCPNCPPCKKYPEFGGLTTWECVELEKIYDIT